MMKRALMTACVCLALSACSADPAAPETESMPQGSWMTADGAGETALIFVPANGAGEIVAICSLGTPAVFRVETPDAGFAAVATGARADIVVGGLTAFEATLSRMPMDDQRTLIQASVPLTADVIEALRAGADLRLTVGAGSVQTGAAPQAEREAFATACSVMAGLAGP